MLGSVCPAVAALSWRRLRKIDRTSETRDEELAYLLAVPMLRPLPLPAIDYLARHLIRRRVPAGAVVFEQGAVADRFYVIALSASPQLLRTMPRATRRASERLRRWSLRTELRPAGERRKAVRTRQLRSSLSNAAADPADPALLKRRSVLSAAQVA